MGGQGIERREVLRYIGIASIAGTFPGFNKWVFACPREHTHDVVARIVGGTGPYKPLFFSAEQFAMIEHLAEMIIPADDTPGAKEAGVAEFIDFMVANRVPVVPRREIRNTADGIAAGNDAQYRFIAGMTWMNAHCRGKFGNEFMKCPAEQQKSLLEELAFKAKFEPATESGRDFFQLVRHYTTVGYYTTKIGLESLGYPGLKPVWTSLPGCPHPNDPEHMHLQEPKASATARDERA